MKSYSKHGKKYKKSCLWFSIIILKMYYNYPLNFSSININWFDDANESFENLCKEYLEKKYQCTECFCLEKWYPALEAKPIQTTEWQYIWFQAKLADTNIKSQIITSLFNGNECKILTDDLERIDILYIITSKKISQNSQEKIILQLKQHKETLEVVFLMGEWFKNELRKHEFTWIRQKYFYNANVSEEYHNDNYSDHNEIINNFCWLNWIPSRQDIELAETTYMRYQYHKLCYSWTDSFNVISEIEDYIYNKKWDTIQKYSEFKKPEFRDLLEKSREEIEKIPWNEGYEIKNLMNDDTVKRGIILQHHVDEKANIKIEDGSSFYIKNT